MRRRRVAAALAEELEARAEAPAVAVAAPCPADLAVEGGCEEVDAQDDFRGWLLHQPGTEICFWLARRTAAGFVGHGIHQGCKASLCLTATGVRRAISLR